MRIEGQSIDGLQCRCPNAQHGGQQHAANFWSIGMRAVGVPCGSGKDTAVMHRHCTKYFKLKECTQKAAQHAVKQVMASCVLGNAKPHFGALISRFSIRSLFCFLPTPWQKSLYSHETAFHNCAWLLSLNTSSFFVAGIIIINNMYVIQDLFRLYECRPLHLVYPHF